MFSRGNDNRSDGPAYAEITLDDGRELKGKFNIPQGRSLADVLNSPSTFVEFEPFGGECIFIAKSAVQEIKPTKLAGAPNLAADLKVADPLDPYAILGVERGVGAEEVHRAYLDLAKTYHPDRFAAVELPPEVMKYLAAMVRRINAAYEEVQDALKKRETRAPRQEPVFTKTGQT